uniref:Uncharacterized protein n=1 Tax=Tanacetum cinerariifolium TaxID=118510 RepID=A0A6L2KPK8_TANCI|nr:hypothetical protein [Tanacetum cinerariifolium]
MLTSDRSDDNKGVSSEGSSITSIPKEGPSIVRRSKEPILKELLEWYGYDTIDDYLPVAKKPIPKNHLVEIQANDHDLLVNSDNENDDMLGYESENDIMHHLGKLLRNFRMKLREKYILPNLITPSKLNELLAKYSAIVKAEEWVEFVNYTTTDAYKIENKEIKADEEPPRGIMWLKGRVNKDEEFTDDDIRSVGDKLKEADDKIKEGTLNLDDGTDAMTVVFGKEKDSVVFDTSVFCLLQVTPPTTIQKISDYTSAPKLQSKQKNYVSRETMQRQARTGKSHMSLNYGS